MIRRIANILTALIISSLVAICGMIMSLNRSSNIVENEIKNIKDKLEKFESKVENLQKSRDDLSEYFVTRREFNGIIEQQNALLANINKQLEKQQDLLMENLKKERGSN